MSASIDVAAALHTILKRYDRIGFGRRGVLDAEQELRGFGTALPPGDEAQFRRIILSWIGKAEAERLAASLHYNLPEHVQALAIRLCANIPILESLPLLRRLDAEGAFGAPEAAICRTALRDAFARLGTAGASE